MNNISYDTSANYNSLIVKITETVNYLKLLSEENRLQILLTLLRDTRSVSEIQTLTKLSQSLVSHHLRDLKDVNLVSSTRSGKWVFYSLTEKGTSTLQVINNL